jgi:hypothetical protein
MANTLKLTRREIATALSASVVLRAQAPAPQLSQNPTLSPDDELKAARDSNHQNSEQLAKCPLAMSTEPAVHFKA